MNAESAILSNGKVNISLIEREIAHELGENAKYHAEDQMKKRAVHISNNYNEFSNFVACSQLKPIQSSEMGDLFTHRHERHHHMDKPNKAPMNKVCHNTLNANNIQSTPLDLPKWNTSQSLKTNDQKPPTSEKLQKKPGMKTKKYKDAAVTNSFELEREWKAMCQTKVQTLQYLSASCRNQDRNQGTLQSCVNNTGNHITIIPSQLRLSPEQVSECLCRVEMDPDMMGDILIALDFLISLLHSGTNEEEEKHPIILLGERYDIFSFIYRWMKSISLCGRFCLNVEFLNDVQKQCMVSIIQFMEHQLQVGGRGCNTSNEEEISMDHILEIKSKFGV